MPGRGRQTQQKPSSSKYRPKGYGMTGNNSHKWSLTHCAIPITHDVRAFYFQCMLSSGSLEPDARSAVGLCCRQLHRHAEAAPHGAPYQHKHGFFLILRMQIMYPLIFTAAGSYSMDELFPQISKRRDIVFISDILTTDLSPHCALRAQGFACCTCACTGFFKHSRTCV